MAGLLVCSGDAEGRSFHEICGKIWKAGAHRFRRRWSARKVPLDRDDPAYEVDSDVCGMCLDGVGLGRG